VVPNAGERMKFGVPWNVKGVRPEARDSAREAARRSGMSVGEWLNNAILEQAGSDGSDSYRDGTHRPARDQDQIRDSIERLDRRLDQIMAQPPQPQARNYQPAYAPPPPPSPDPWSTTIEQAIAEISARQQILDGGQPATPLPHYASPPMAPSYQSNPSPIPRWPVQDLSGLERQLRHITEQIELLHHPRETDDIAALRKELGEIGARLNEAVPQRVIEALENQIKGLTGKLDLSRQNGVDPTTLAGIERNLSEMRDALRELRPAESLAGFDQAVRGISAKIDQMGAGGHDPAFLQQLEAAVGGLRGIVSHVASNDSLAKLADEVRGLARKIDGIGQIPGDADKNLLSSIEQRIAALPEQIRAGAKGPEIPSRLETLLKNFTDRLDRGELTSGEQFALGTLEDRIVSLAAKLDASDSRLNQLGAIERGLADLLVRVDELRGNPNAARGPAAPAVNELKRDVARTQDSLEAVHGTVGDVVDRLAMLETERRGAAATPQAAASANEAPVALPAPPVAVNPVITVDTRSIEPSPQQMAQRVKAGAPASRPRAPIDPNLPPDYPLEPGSGGPRSGATPADRIAASEAALGAASPMPSASTGSTNFIAAARRAAQAAAPADTGTTSKVESSKPEKSGKSLGQRVRSLLAGTGVILVIAGGYKVATTVLEPGSMPGVAALSSLLLREPSRSEVAEHSAVPEDETASIPTRGEGDSGAVSSLLQGKATLAQTPRAAMDMPQDVTGSIAAAPAAASVQPESLPPLTAPATDQRLVAPEHLPAALRTAATAGDPAAAYEVALRHLEGRGLPQSLEEAVRWLDRAARAGLAPAQFRLGNLYEKGQGVKKNLDTAQRLYLAAANKGNAKAMHNLAVLHAEGAQGKPDYKQAGLWFRKAAEHGIADSQYNLGILHARGIGVEQNFAESYKWFSLAAAQGDKESAKKRDEVASRLDNQSLTAARLATQTFIAKPQPAEATAIRTPDGGWERTGATPKPARKPRTVEPLRITPS